MRALVVTDLNFPEKGPMRLRAMAELGIETQALSLAPIRAEGSGCREFSLFYRLAHRLGHCPDTEKVNAAIREAVEARRFDFLWIEKGNMVTAATLRHVRAAAPDTRLFWYSEDDMFMAHNQSRAFLEALPLYDCVFTTKARNGDAGELPALGARGVVPVDKAFDPLMHKPVEVTTEERAALGADVGFIGTYEDARAAAMAMLAENGIRVRVWGNGWESCRHRHPNLVIENRPVVNTPSDLLYTKAIAATRINLGFLRRINRDQQTDRSVEIPACGGFMLAERSEEHRRLFEEGREAEYFASPEELLEKTRFYLVHEEKRAAIAEAGRRRCLESDYTHLNRMRFMLAQGLAARS